MREDVKYRLAESTTKHCKIGRSAIELAQSYIQSWGAYQRHDIPNSALHVKSLNTLNTDHATLRSQCRELDESSISFHDLANLIQSAQQDTIDLCRRDYCILHEDSCPGYELVYLLLR